MKRERPPLDKFLPPRPPEGLRGRVLGAAEGAWASAPLPPPGRRARFGPWDWAWAAALVLLVVANALVGGRPRRSPAPTAMASEEKAEATELASLGIVAPRRPNVLERPGTHGNVHNLSDAAGAGL